MFLPLLLAGAPPVVGAPDELVVEAHRLLALARVDGADIPWASCRLRDETPA
jgi:hypothetical protein